MSQRRACIAAFVVIAAGSFAALAGSSFDIALYRLLSDGLLVMAWLIAAGGIGAVVVRWRGNSLRAVTSVAIGLGIVALVMMLLGAVGFLNRPICIALIGVGCCLAIARLILARKSLPPISTYLNAPAGWAWLWLLAAPLVGTALVAATVPPGVLWGDEPNGYDVLEYHLQIPREWEQAGRMMPLDYNAFGYFPQGVEMHYLLAMELAGGPWAGMYAASFMHLALVALFVFAVYAAAAALGDGTGSSAGGGGAHIAGVGAAVVPWTTLLAPIAYNEGGLLLYGTSALGWVLLAARGGREARRSRKVIVAGVCAGLACGVKLTAVPAILVAVPVAMVLAATASPGYWRLLAGMILFGVVAVFAFSPWLARNAAWTGNPVFPEGRALFGDGPFTPVQSVRWTRAHSPTPAQRSIGAHLAAARSQILADWRYGYVLIPLGVLAGLVSLRRFEVRFLLILLLLQFIFWIGFTHLQGRFFILAIPICALLIGLMPRMKWLAPAGVIVAIGSLVAIALVLDKFAPMAAQFRAAGALGIENLSFMIPSDAASDIADGTPIALVGDARAFAYQMPMSRLRYRTVFDVKGTSGQPIVQAWLGSPARPDEAVVIDPPEIQRLSRTYYDVPGLSPADPAYGRMPFVIPPHSPTR